MERHSRSLRSRLGKTPIQKPLCRLCECPTSDGHVLASQVDRFKLRKWAMEVMNLTEEDENLPDVVEEDALICYFCIWQAEFGDESGDEAVAWWPKNLDLEENARVLRENYSVGEVEQCWVQLEEIDLGKYTKKISTKWTHVSGVCIYCGNRFIKLMDHVRLMHKEAIKCGIRGCTTYFHTEEEKEQHMQQDIHANQCESRDKIRCKFCKNCKIFSSRRNLRRHMKLNHPELPFVCTRVGCEEYFKFQSEKILHINSFHRKKGTNQDLLQCKHCEYFTKIYSNLRRHEEAKHMPKTFNCDLCDAKFFGSKCLVKDHYIKVHTFKKCKSCRQNVALANKGRHRRPNVCSRCKLSFECSGLYQLHGKKCQESFCRCKECGKSFTKPVMCNLHVRRVHTKTVPLSCDLCYHSTFIKRSLLEHIERIHFPKTIQCGECDNLFASTSLLNTHKHMRHEYVRCAECSQEICRQYFFHHQTAKTCRRCKSKFKCRGLLEKHNESCQSNNVYCDMCPNIYTAKKYLYSHIVKKHIDV
ncbi:zinc finger protein 25-like isoform X2 [Cloeon dipterum]|uniref:zinc finger protein 25-like isoform X2 n=1 Tax=Cloeon dipterum TaxID=197152 RepID=UPI0032200779